MELGSELLRLDGWQTRLPESTVTWRGRNAAVITLKVIALRLIVLFGGWWHSDDSSIWQYTVCHILSHDTCRLITIAVTVIRWHVGLKLPIDAEASSRSFVCGKLRRLLHAPLASLIAERACDGARCTFISTLDLVLTTDACGCCGQIRKRLAVAQSVQLSSFKTIIRARTSGDDQPFVLNEREALKALRHVPCTFRNDVNELLFWVDVASFCVQSLSGVVSHYCHGVRMVLRTKRRHAFSCDNYVGNKQDMITVIL